jgi:hypothetical protein
MPYTHTYTMNKGYPAKFKGQSISWTNQNRVADAIGAGDFRDEETLVRAAYALLNIKRGHAAQASATEKGEKGEDLGGARTVADLQEVARGTNFGKGFAARAAGKGGINAKVATKVGRRSAEIAKAAAADPKKLAALRTAGYTDEDLREMGVLPAEAATEGTAPKAARR